MNRYKVTEHENSKVETITMTPLEVAKMLGVSRATIYKMVREDEIPSFKVRGKILFHKDIIMRWTKGEYKVSEEAVKA